jgi:hypothetical protein
MYTAPALPGYGNPERAASATPRHTLPVTPTGLWVSVHFPRERTHTMPDPDEYAGRCEWCDTPHKYQAALDACETHCANDRGRE